MIINEVKILFDFITNKEQAGNTYTIPQFNALAKAAQIEFISSRLGNVKVMENKLPDFGYRSSRKIDVDLRPMVYGPIQIPIDNQGHFIYPDRMIYPDTISKTDYRQITELDEDEYPRQKHSSFDPPTEDYPVVIYRNPYGFIDPYNIGAVNFTYLRLPDDPVWGYDVVSNREVFNPAKSTDLGVNPHTGAHLEVLMIMLQHVGIRLDQTQITMYAQQKAMTG